MPRTPDQGPNSQNQEKEKRIQQVKTIVEALLKGTPKEVESAQPDNLTQYETSDSEGNELITIYDLSPSAVSIEVRDKNDKLFCQGLVTDAGITWFVDRYTAEGAGDFTTPRSRT